MRHAIVSSAAATPRRIAELVAPNAHIARILEDVVIISGTDLDPALRALNQRGITAMEISRTTAEILLNEEH